MKQRNMRVIQIPSISIELEAFIRKQLGFSCKRAIRPGDQMESDFGVEGDPADDFMFEFGRQFNVEPGDFDFERYFEPEGLGFPSCLACWILKRRGYLKVPKEPLTVAMLQRAIDLGLWDTEKLREAGPSRD
jgi:hypothetical protein